MEPPVSHSGVEEPEARTPVVSSGTSLVAGSQSPTTSRLWRPAAQRNMRNQWSRLVSCKGRWVSASSEGRASATGLVNAYLSRRQVSSSRKNHKVLLVHFVCLISLDISGRRSPFVDDNFFVYFRYMPEMNLGVLKDMPMIREKACEKLTRKQVSLLHLKPFTERLRSISSFNLLKMNNGLARKRVCCMRSWCLVLSLNDDCFRRGSLANSLDGLVGE